jgi:hypothetical protein
MADKPDPIYRVIETHQAALRDFDRAETQQELDIAGMAERGARRALLIAEPTTLIGLADLCQYVVDTEWYSPAFPENEFLPRLVEMLRRLGKAQHG